MPEDHNNECSKSTSAYDNLPSTTPLPYIDSSLIDPVGTDLLSSPNPPSTDPPSLTNPQSSTDPPSSSDSSSSTDPQSSSVSQSTDPPSLTDSQSSNDPPSSSNPLSLTDPRSSTGPPLLVNFAISSNNGNLLPKSLPEFLTENCKQSDQNILEKAKQIFYSLYLQEEQCVAVEKAT